MAFSLAESSADVVWMGALLLGVFVALWLVLPQYARWRRRDQG